MTSDQPSLRGLAAILGVSHPALSNAIRRGTLSAGIGRDARGRAVVVDAAAAATEWREIHVPSYHELMRSSAPPAPPARRPPPPSDPLDTVLRDPAYGWPTTAREAIAERDRYSLLVTALASVALDVADRDQVEAKVTARLHVVAALHGADGRTIAAAAQDLASTVSMLVDAAAEPEPEPALRAVP